jgi:transcriptional regulatory protein RtcR
MSKRSTVVIGLLGVQKDRGARRAQRWDSWRPTVGLCQQEELVVDRLEILRQKRFSTVASEVKRDIARVSPETTVREHAIEFRDPWDFEDVFSALHDFARGYDFDPEREDYLVHITTGTHVAQICLFLLTESRHFPARLIQSSPPMGNESDVRGTVRIIDLDLARYDGLASRFEAERREGLDLLGSGIATRDPEFRRQLDEIEKVAGVSRSPMLILGPTGAGKSRLARRVHELKRRRHLLAGELVEVNCATLRGDTAMSTLFGHRKGAFTGALSDREGLLKSADGGLLFLDEIGELGLDEQAMLLRALEEKRFLPLGADREVESEFQLIAGTNRDLRAEVQGGRFRDDLLARIDHWTFHLPGLSERSADIEANLDWELDRFAEREGRRARFTSEARRRYLDFATGPAGRWPGNFRDLHASAARMATLAEAGRIRPENVEDEIARLERSWGATHTSDEGRAADEIAELRVLLGDEAFDQLDRFDRVQLADVVAVCRRSPTLSAAGRDLFAVSRLQRRSANDADRLRKYLARHGLRWEQLQS